MLVIIVEGPRKRESGRLAVADRARSIGAEPPAKEKRVP
jgi:hypothetical protein